MTHLLEHNGSPPDHADAVVIGGGIIGVMSAWELAKSGLSVVVLEKGRVAGEQSSRNWGWIRAQGRDPAEIEIMLLARQMWHEMAQTVPEDIGLRQTGVAYLANDDDEISRYAAWLKTARDFDLDSKILSRSQTRDLIPDATSGWAGALWTPSDMKAEPWIALPALARAAVRDGVAILEGCAARGLDISAGKVSGVITEAGVIKSERVILAGGSWSSLFLRRHGINIPQLSVRATVAATKPLGHVFDGGAVDSKLAFRRRADGGYTLAPSGFHELFVGPDAFRALRGYATALIADPLGTRLLPKAPKGFPDAWGTERHWADDAVTPFEKMRVLNPTPNATKVAKLARDFGTTFPPLGAVEINMAWAGMIDTMPDVVPIVDHAPLEGLTIATGMCGHGFGIGPAFGQIAAQLALGIAPKFDLSRFRFSRFHDGSKLHLGPNL